MELSAIVKKYDLPLTRSERTLVAQLPTGTTAVSENRYEQQMKALAAARDVIAQLPDKHTLERQRTMEKAGMLKDRLKMLCRTVRTVSPSRCNCPAAWSRRSWAVSGTKRVSRLVLHYADMQGGIT